MTTLNTSFLLAVAIVTTLIHGKINGFVVVVLVSAWINTRNPTKP